MLHRPLPADVQAHAGDQVSRPARRRIRFQDARSKTVHRAGQRRGALIERSECGAQAPDSASLLPRCVETPCTPAPSSATTPEPSAKSIVISGPAVSSRKIIQPPMRSRSTEQPDERERGGTRNVGRRWSTHEMSWVRPPKAARIERLVATRSARRRRECNIRCAEPPSTFSEPNQSARNAARKTSSIDQRREIKGDVDACQTPRIVEHPGAPSSSKPNPTT